MTVTPPRDKPRNRWHTAAWRRTLARVTDIRDDWSPADNSYSIALSQSQWWMRAARLTALRMRDGDDRRENFSSRQIDARLFIITLQQLLVAEKLEQDALSDLGIDAAAGEALSNAREQFEAAVPDVKHMRDGLIHFEDWSRGKGRGPQKERLKTGELERDVARFYWGFSYDPTAGTVALGPYTINVDTAVQAAQQFSHAIYMAAREVDRAKMLALRAEVVRTLADAGVPCEAQTDAVKVSPGNDQKVWVSVLAADLSDSERQQLSGRVLIALATGGFRLVHPTEPENGATIEHLIRYALQVEVDESGAAKAS